jgi:hypothetical protein
MPDSNSTRAALKDARAIFDRALKTYCECLCAPLEKCASYDPNPTPTPIRAPNSPTTNYICDFDIMLRRALGSDRELNLEFDRLFDIEMGGTKEEEAVKPPPPSKEERARTNRVVALVSAAARKRHLDSLSYFRPPMKKRIEA